MFELNVDNYYNYYKDADLSGRWSNSEAYSLMDEFMKGRQIIALDVYGGCAYPIVGITGAGALRIAPNCILSAASDK